MKTGDTEPGPELTLLDAAGAPVNLTGATVRFIMATSATPRAIVVDAVAVLADAASGRVDYVWGATDTATAGSYVAEVEVTYASGRVQTFPTSGYFDITINEDLGGTV